LVGLRRQAGWFTVIGVAATGTYLLLYLALRQLLSPQPANYLAWAITAILDTAANRRWTFDATCRVSQVRAQIEGLLIFVVSLVSTSLALAVLDAWVTDPGRPLETAALVGANLVAGLLRFELLRRWVFAEREMASGPC
jgi:putative flippase GtrA